MKLKCVRDYDDETTGFIIKNTKRVKVDGITAGKIYEGMLAPTVQGDGNLGFGTIRTYYQFMVFGDDNEWGMYDIHHFEPA